MTRVTVQVEGSVAEVLHGGAGSLARHRELMDATRRLGVTLEPMHPGTGDPSLRTFFTVDVDDSETARRVVETLGTNPAVLAAYVKPMDAPP